MSVRVTGDQLMGITQLGGGVRNPRASHQLFRILQLKAIFLACKAYQI